MESTPTMNYVDDLKIGKEELILKVKILLLWKSYFNRDTSKLASMDMIVMDEKGSKIHATVKKAWIKKFESLLEEGGIRILSNFGVLENSGPFRVLGHEGKVDFRKETEVKYSDVFNCDKDGFQYLDFNQAIFGDLRFKIGFDVIGRVISTCDMVVKKNGTRESRVLNFRLQNERNEVIPCALWDMHALKLQKVVNANRDSNDPIFILIQLAQFSSYMDKPKISNWLYGSKVYINDDLPQLIEFRHRFFAVGNDTSSSGTVVQLSSNTIYSSLQDDFTSVVYKKIKQLKKIDMEVSCVIVGKVVSVEHTYGWYYKACRNCNKSVQPVTNNMQLENSGSQQLLSGESQSLVTDLQIQLSSLKSENETAGTEKGTKFMCKKCGPVSNMYPRIKLHLKVEDDTDETIVALFEKDVVQFTNKTASYLLAKSQNDATFAPFPIEFDLFKDNVYAFFVKVTEWNLDRTVEVFTASKITDDPNIIQSVIATSANNKAESEDVDAPLLALESSEGCVDSKEAISVIGDNDTPVEIVSSSTSTPGCKRKHEEVDSDMGLQASSTKSVGVITKMKIPKIEKD